MNRYKKTFAHLKKEKQIGFCPFAVLGDPNPRECLVRIKKYLETEPDFLELGIPFSDPVADGPTVQAADERALRAGMTPKKAIKLVSQIRALTNASTEKHNAPEIPIGILVYSNIVFHYGIQKFYRDLAKVGADSVLIADVPLEEIAPFIKAARANKIHQIFLVSEYTDTKRLKKIEHTGNGGFLYVVSTLGVTGARKELPPTAIKLIKNLKRKTRMPLIMGFGISQPEHIRQLKKAGANGAIVGSLLVKTLTKNLPKTLRSLKAAAGNPTG